MSREEFCKEVEAGEKSKAALCRAYGISRATGDKWLARYAAEEGLENRSRAPHHKPKKTPAETEALVLSKRQEHPAWGPRKLLASLEREGHRGLPCKSTIGNILVRNGCIREAASQAAKAYQRFQKNSSNEMWQTDFKGHFAMQNGERCHPLTVLDDYSRYSLCIDAKENEKRGPVMASFERIFKEYGLPDSLLCDNGNPWGASQSTGYTLFEVWLMDLNILTIHGRIRHPQTQGKEERFHRTMEDELLKGTAIQDMVDAQKQFDRFRSSYNTERPHEALNMGVPSEYYSESKRSYPTEMREWEYANEFAVRKIKSSGYLTHNGQGYFLSEALAGKTVGVRESAMPGCISVYYRNFRIARVNEREKAVISRKMRRGEVTPAVDSSSLASGSVE